MGIDYYAVLDIARSCSDVDIKLAYRKLALRTHPKRVDYQQHTKHFSTGSALPLPKLPVGVLWEYINESYEVLIDPLLRQIYDTFGEEGLKSGVFCPNGSTKPFAYHGDCMKTFRNFFGTYSPYADLIDAVNPTIYNPGGTALKVKDKDIESLLYLNLKEVFFGGSKTIKISRYEFVDDFKTKTEKR